MMNKTFSIYVHIPFCQSKCIYCDFASFVVPEDKVKKYFDALCQEIERCEFSGKAKTVYFGGGTPSCVDAENIERVLLKLKEKFDFDEACEISIECNPASADKSKLERYRKMGINRISFGVQSLNDEQLAFLGRRHKSVDALESIALAKEVGFENISADLLLGLPKSSANEICEFCGRLIESGVTHISAYMLQVEEGTPLAKMVGQGKVILPSDDMTADIYEKVTNKLDENNFERYEISNFEKKGFECKHNLAYWQGKDYLGFGLGAVGCENGVRKMNGKTFDDYYDGKSYQEKLTLQEQIEEIIMLGLRTKYGFEIEKLKALGYNISKNDNYKKFLSQGIIKEKDGFVAINKNYFGVSNEIIVKLFP